MWCLLSSPHLLTCGLQLFSINAGMIMVGRFEVKFTPFYLLLACLVAPQLQAAEASDTQNNLAYAVAWKQTAAEHRALYYQGFNIARMRVEQALAAHTPGDRPLAIVSDVDETLLLANDYWGYLVNERRDFFDDAIWDVWVPENGFTASPGALEFLQFCAANGVEIFYVTNRDQGEATYELARQNLLSVGFPAVDEEHLTVLRETSNKETVQQGIGERYDVVVLLGDNLNDFSRRYYTTDVNERLALVAEDRNEFADRFILFPNPTDGHWIRAIFGDSEPPANDANRLRWQEAATRNAWPGP